MDRARQGDVNAFAEVFEAARPVVFAVVCRVVGPSEAEDVVMDTYLKAWKAMPGFDARSSPRTWLCRIAHNCAVDFLRKRRPLPASGEAGDGAADREVEERADPGQRTPPEILASLETDALIQDALNRVSPEHRTTLLLRFSDGLSYSEIAKATGVSIGTVMSRIFNGRRKLMRLIKEGGGREP